jgi:hypothetical protein
MIFSTPSCKPFSRRLPLPSQGRKTPSAEFQLKGVLICLLGDQPCDTNFGGVNVFEFTGPAGLCALFTLVRGPLTVMLKSMGCR